MLEYLEEQGGVGGLEEREENKTARLETANIPGLGLTLDTSLLPDSQTLRTYTFQTSRKAVLPSGL